MKYLVDDVTGEAVALPTNDSVDLVVRYMQDRGVFVRRLPGPLHVFLLVEDRSQHLMALRIPGERGMVPVEGMSLVQGGVLYSNARTQRIVEISLTLGESLY